MNPPEVHAMDVELVADRQTVRYTCPVCQRCLEDGPEGLTMIHQGDQSAVHRGGMLAPALFDAEPGADEVRTLH